MKQLDCSRCPDSPDKDCADPRHSCNTCNGVGIVRAVNISQDTFTACPDCTGYTYTGEKPLGLLEYHLTDGQRRRKVRNTGKKTQKR